MRIFIVTVCIILLVLIMLNLYTFSYIDKLDKTLIDIYNNYDYNTGDIILCRYVLDPLKPVDEYLYKISLSSSFYRGFTHTAILVKLDNIPYVLNLTPDEYFCEYNQKLIREKPVLNKMSSLLNEYHGNIYVIKYKGHITNEYTKNSIEYIFNQGYLYDNETFTNVMRLIFDTDEKKMMCADFVIKVLQHLKINLKYITNHRYNISDILKLTNESSLYDSNIYTLKILSLPQ